MAVHRRVTHYSAFTTKQYPYCADVMPPDPVWVIACLLSMRYIKDRQYTAYEQRSEHIVKY